jgi:hypothetical protein
MQAGERGVAWERLQRTVELMAKTVPPAPTLFSGYVAALEVALRFFLAPQSNHERAEAGGRLRTVLLHALRFALRFPVGRPRVLSAIGRLLWAQGQTALAGAALLLALDRATHMGMQHEQALCHLWLGRLALAEASGSTGRSRARLHLETAAKRFSEQGYVIDLAESRALLATLPAGA